MSSSGQSGPDNEFAAVLGTARGTGQETGPVWVVFDSAGHGIGGPRECPVFASRSRETAEQVAGVWRKAAETTETTDSGGVGSIIVRVTTEANYERMCERLPDVGPGPLDRVPSAAEEAALLGLAWPD